MKQRESSRFTVAQGEIEIQPASLAETAVVAAILREAAIWLEQRGMALWQASAFEPEHLMPDVADGQYMLARWHGLPAGVFKYQHEHPLIWPDALPGEQRISTGSRFVAAMRGVNCRRCCCKRLRHVPSARDAASSG